MPLDLQEAEREAQSTLMGGSVVFAAAVPPCLMQPADNPEGPLTPDKAQEKRHGLERDRQAYFEQFTRTFFSAQGELKVSASQHRRCTGLHGFIRLDGFPCRPQGGDRTHRAVHHSQLVTVSGAPHGLNEALLSFLRV